MQVEGGHWGGVAWGVELYDPVPEWDPFHQIEQVRAYMCGATQGIPSKHPLLQNIMVQIGSLTVLGESVEKGKIQSRDP